ncbi:hypothetical protein [Acidisphaera sp. L21]|uniref:hypothetical protein n=1 Tax=Acidisphaera sp. L21 TaxID=1641851 RepID=UPI0030064C35
MNLPVLDGWTVTRMLRVDKNLTLIIALTAHAMTGNQKSRWRPGATTTMPSR